MEMEDARALSCDSRRDETHPRLQTSAINPVSRVLSFSFASANSIEDSALNTIIELLDPCNTRIVQAKSQTAAFVSRIKYQMDETRPERKYESSTGTNGEDGDSIGR